MKTLSFILAAVLATCACSQAHAQILTYSSGVDTAPTVEPNLLAISGTLTAQSGSFSQESTGPLSVLNDNSGGLPSDSSTWTAIGSGSSLTYTLDTNINTLGYDITGVDLYSGWGDFGRGNVTNVTVSYELVGGSTFTTLLDGSTIVDQGLAGGGDGVYEQVDYSNSGATLISGVQAVRFDFGPQQNGYVGYRELDIVGTSTAVPEPSSSLLLLLSGAALATWTIRKKTAMGIAVLLE